MRSSEPRVERGRPGPQRVEPLALPGAGRALALPETIIGVLIALQFPPGLLGQNKAPLQLALACFGIGYMALRAAAPLQRPCP